MIIGSIIVGCSEHRSEASNDPALAQENIQEHKTAQGVLRHFPSDIKSTQAWYRHNFLVGDTPVIATSAVPEETLRKFIGSEVIVSGVWHPGEQWKPTEEESCLQSPIHPDGEVVVRGEGIKASSIKPAE